MGCVGDQDLLRNREIIKLMAESKCRGLFTGIEFVRPEFIAAHNKRQNEQRGERNVAEDIAYAESLGMMITYGYLFDPRMSTIAEMEAELRSVLNSELLHHPYFWLLSRRSRGRSCSGTRRAVASCCPICGCAISTGAASPIARRATAPRHWENSPRASSARRIST